MGSLKLQLQGAAAAMAVCACASVHAQPAPPFDVAYRAWEAVTEIARHNHNAALGGSCSRTFRAFVIPGLRQQTKAEQEVAATACVGQARSVCANPGIARTPDLTKKCAEFR